MPVLVRSFCLMAFMVLAVNSVSPAATPKEIDAAIQKGAAFLKTNYTKGAKGLGGMNGIGPSCLSGLAILEAGAPVDDPAITTIAGLVREAAYTQTKTYQVALCLMFLDRLGEPADVPLIQALAARLITGQGADGGWNYEVCAAVPQNDVQVLKAIKADQKPGKLHPTVEEYGKELARRRTAGESGMGPIAAQGGSDNSNSQFAIIAVWMARKHGMPVEGALDLVEKRYLSTQNPNTGGWNYVGAVNRTTSFSPSMHCAGLIGLSTAVARREDRLNKTELVKKKDPPPKVGPGGASKKGDDPFFNPPAASGGDAKKSKTPARQPDARDRAVHLGMTGLGMILAESAKAGRGSLYLADSSAAFGMYDLYFYWSLERVGVIYGVEKLGGIDWYDAGSTTLVRTQAQGGNWNGRYGLDVDTAFAVLFLCKSNLARDLSSKVQKEVSTEMRAGAVPSGSGSKTGGEPGTVSAANPIILDPVIRGPEGNEAAVIAGELLRSTDKDWAAVLKKLRDTKGAIYTTALVAATSRLEGVRLKESRGALAERLTRMTADTLRAMAKDEEIELRRAAVLAMAMKDDKTHIPDLVNALLDDEELVIRAAKAGLKSLAGQDFGPRVNATAGDKKLAVTAWNEWLGKQKR